MYDEIKKIILNFANDIDEESLTYFTNYFYAVLEMGVIPDGITLNELIEKTMKICSKIEFFDDEHWVRKEYGTSIKGLKDEETGKIYIYKFLPDFLREIMVYHEIHHLVQTNPDNNKIGINYTHCYGRLIMDAQSQWVAEQIYKLFHGCEFPIRLIPSEEARMLPGGTIVSDLNNYEMYDSMLSKLAIVLGVPKEFFVRINYLYKDNTGLKQLEDVYNRAYEAGKIEYLFDDLMFIFDYIYCVDLMVYRDNPDRNTILNGGTSSSKFLVHSDRCDYLSLELQKNCINRFDSSTFLSLLKSNGDYSTFASYIMDNSKRKIVEKYMAPLKFDGGPVPGSK